MKNLARAWYGPPSAWLRALLPLSWLFRRLAQRRRQQYRSGQRPLYRAPVPVIIVGNISVGGTGKTPLVAWLAKRFQEQGLRPGIVSRGYGSRAPAYPYDVRPDSPPSEAGDEALLLARNSACPVVIAPDRGAAARHLLASHPCDLLISDDGLQHYALARDIEIAVIDGQRGLGNAWLLPAGPLREPRERLLEVDFIVSNGAIPEDVEAFLLRRGPGSIHSGFARTTPARPPTVEALEAQEAQEALFQVHEMQLRPLSLINLKTGERKAPQGQGRQVHAVAGIGNPQRFFDTLQSCDFAIIPAIFSDHHAFQAQDLAFPDDLNIVMTEKDAVKCQPFADARCWYLKVEATLPQSFFTALLSKLNDCSANPMGHREHG